MNIPRSRYNEIVIALDGIRCDNRENQQYTENENLLRKMHDDIMQYIERKGYCKYIYGANGKFVRTLTKSGYEILSCNDYGKYRRDKAIENVKSWLSVLFSGLALIISIGVAILNHYDNINKAAIENRVKQLETSTKLLTDSINAFRLQTTREQNPTIYLLDSAYHKGH